MVNIFDYISNYADFHAIGRYNLKCKVVTKETLADVNNILRVAGGVAFFYDMCAVGEISAVTNIGMPFLQIDTNGDFIDYKFAEVVDFGTVQKVASDYIFTVENMAKFNLQEGAGCMFDKIHTFSMKYMYLTPLAADRAEMQSYYGNAGTQPQLTQGRTAANGNNGDRWAAFIPTDDNDSVKLRITN